jgi:hypothetical protein
VKALVQTAMGTFAVDLTTEDLEPADGTIDAPHVELSLPRVVASASSGSTVVAVVDRKPPLMLSYDAGATWREAGAGLPAGVAVAIGADPDIVLYASRNRLHVSENGGIFWRALAVELPQIEAIELTEA